MKKIDEIIKNHGLTMKQPLKFEDDASNRQDALDAKARLSSKDCYSKASVEFDSDNLGKALSHYKLAQKLDKSDKNKGNSI